MLDMPQEFYGATTTFVRDRVAEIKVIEHDHAIEAMFRALQAEKRSREALVYASHDIATKGLGGCEPSRATFGSFIVALRTARIWPYQAQSVLQMEDGVDRMPTIPDNKCGYLCGCQHVTDLMSSLTTTLGTIYNSAKGVCLDCIKRQYLGTMGKCRAYHDGMKN
jgi:hypothetical protein